MKKPTKPTGFVPTPGRPVRAADPAEAAAERLRAEEAVLAAHTKAAYVHERTVWQSARSDRLRAYHPPKVYDGRDALALSGGVVVERARPSEWVALVRWCRGRAVEPVGFVRTVFMFLEPDRVKPPEPRQLRADHWLEEYRRNLPKIEARLRSAFAAQRSGAVTRITYERTAGGAGKRDAYERVLCMEGLELSPLFRYCLAREVGGKRFRVISRRFLDAAILQFMRHPDVYADVWGDFLPPSFAATARAEYVGVLARTQ